MFKKQGEKNLKKMDTIIGPETIIQGKITIVGSLRIDGKVYGEVECDGDIIIGEKGHVETNVKARNIIVAGTLNGKVVANEKLHIHSTGKFIGSAQINALIIEEGGFYQGESNMNLKEDKVKPFNSEKKQLEKNQSA